MSWRITEEYQRALLGMNGSSPALHGAPARLRVRGGNAEVALGDLVVCYSPLSEVELDLPVTLHAEHAASGTTHVSAQLEQGLELSTQLFCLLHA